MVSGVAMIKLAIFDMDGTIFESYLDWAIIKKKLGLENKNILQEIFRGDVIDNRRLSMLERYEKENTLKTKPIAGIRSFLDFLRTHHVIPCLITNNNLDNTRYLLDKFKLDFTTVITREMKFWKPEPGAFLYLMKIHSCRPEETVSVGDSHYDILASKKAEIPNIFIKKSEKIKMDNGGGVVVFDDYHGLRETLRARLLKEKP